MPVMFPPLLLWPVRYWRIDNFCGSMDYAASAGECTVALARKSKMARALPAIHRRGFEIICGCAYSRSGRNSTAGQPLRFDQQNEGHFQPRHRRTGRPGRSNHRRHLCLTKQVFPRGARDDAERRAGPFARLQRGLPRRTFSALFPSPPSRSPVTVS